MKSAIAGLFLFVYYLSRQRCEDRIPDRLANVRILFLVIFVSISPEQIELRLGSTIDGKTYLY